MLFWWVNCFENPKRLSSTMKIPENHQQIMPYLMLKDAPGFIQFMQEVFGATLTISHNRPGSEVIMKLMMYSNWTDS